MALLCISWLIVTNAFVLLLPSYSTKWPTLVSREILSQTNLLFVNSHFSYIVLLSFQHFFNHEFAAQIQRPSLPC
jgi:hypothetical protein